MSTITMSKTWQQRLRRGRPGARPAGRVIVAACAVFGFAAGVKVFFVAAPPDDADVAAIAHRVDNQRDAAGQFAADFVVAVLRTPATKHDALKRFISFPE